MSTTCMSLYGSSAQNKTPTHCTVSCLRSPPPQLMHHLGQLHSCTPVCLSASGFVYSFVFFKLYMYFQLIDDHCTKFYGKQVLFIYVPVFSLLADSYGSYAPSMLLTPASYPNAPLSHTSSRAFSSNKQTTPLGPRGRSTSAPNVSFVTLDRGATEEVCHILQQHGDLWVYLSALYSDLVCADNFVSCIMI